MRILIITFLTCLFGVSVLQAQNDCPYYNDLIKEANRLWKQGAFEKALNQLSAAREHCPGRSEEVDAQLAAFTREITRKYEEAERERIRANKKAFEADSIAKVNKKQALTAYANELASQSQLALRNGNRTTAFRLAEFAYNFLDQDNLNVKRVLAETLYFNEHPDSTNWLPWYSTFPYDGNFVSSICFSSDNKQLALVSGEGAQLYDIKSGVNISEHNPLGRFERYSIIDFNSENRCIGLKKDLRKNSIELWDVFDKIKIDSFNLTDIQTLSLGNWDYCSKSNLVLLGEMFGRGSLKVFDITEKAFIDSLPFNYLWNRRCVDLASNGNLLAIGTIDGRIIVRDVQAKTNIDTIFSFTSVDQLVFSPDSKLIASYSNFQTVQVWDRLEKRRLLSLDCQELKIRCLAFSPNGAYLAAGTEEGFIQVWNLSELACDGCLLHVSSGPISGLDFSPDGQNVVYGLGVNYGYVEGVNLDTNKKDTLLNRGDWRFIKRIQYLPDAKHLVVCSGGIVEIIDLSTKKVDTLLTNSNVGHPVISKNGRFLGVDNGFSDSITIWEIGSKMKFKQFESAGAINSMALSHDGIFLALGYCCNLPEIRNLQNGDIIKLELPPNYEISEITRIEYSPSSYLLSAGHEDGTISLWDGISGKFIAELGRKGRVVTALRLSPDSNYLVAGNVAGEVMLWELATFRLVFRLKVHEDFIESLVFSPDGKYLTSSSLDGKVKKLAIEIGEMIPEVDSDFDIAGFTTSQIIKYGLDDLLKIQPENFDRLLALSDSNQIIGYISIYSQKAIRLGLDSRALEYFHISDYLLRKMTTKVSANLYSEQYETLYTHWADYYLELNQPDSALVCITKLCNVFPNRNVCSKYIFQAAWKYLLSGNHESAKIAIELGRINNQLDDQLEFLIPIIEMMNGDAPEIYMPKFMEKKSNYIFFGGANALITYKEEYLSRLAELKSRGIKLPAMEKVVRELQKP